MDWLRENWFWAGVFILFIGMHMFGHGHGGHGGHGGGHSRRGAGGCHGTPDTPADGDDPDSKRDSHGGRHDQY